MHYLPKKLSKNNKIKPIFLNKTIKIYNGKNFYELKISKNMIGYKIGDFIFTRPKFNK
jgi:small subunit ribosomal protein S19